MTEQILTSEHVQILRHAAERLIASHEQLRRDIRPLMGEALAEHRQQIKMYDRIDAGIRDLNGAVSALGLAFEAQFEKNN